MGMSIKEGGAPWGRQHYKKAAARALQAFQLDTMEGDQSWVTACRDNSQQGKAKWAQLIRKGAEKHYTIWYNHRRDRTSAGITRSEPTTTLAQPEPDIPVVFEEERISETSKTIAVQGRDGISTTSTSYDTIEVTPEAHPTAISPAPPLRRRPPDT